MLCKEICEQEAEQLSDEARQHHHHYHQQTGADEETVPVSVDPVSWQQQWQREQQQQQSLCAGDMQVSRRPEVAHLHHGVLN